MITSVIVCTYNRSDLLEGSLRSLAAQDIQKDQYEIIVVDNNSSDDTREVVEAFASTSPVRVRYFFEGRQGLSFARNCGIEAAQGDIVVFTDDDIEAEPRWLREVIVVFNSSEVACAGGPIRPLWPIEKPQWLTRDWEGFLTISEFEDAKETGFFHYPSYPWGANIAFRKTVFASVGVFPTDLGRIGKSLLSNEELNLCKRIEDAGFKIAFAPGAVIHHKIAPERISKSWMMHRAYWQGRSDAILDTWNSPFRYDRLRQFGKQTFWHQTKDEQVTFSTICINRSVMGYMDQLLLVPEFSSANHFRKLRVLKTFLGGLITMTRETIAAKSRRIASLESEVASQDQLLQVLKQQIAEHQERLAPLEQRIAQQRAWLTDRENDIRSRDQWLAECNQQLEEHRKWLVEREQEVRDRDMWLAAREKEIQNRDQWLAERDQQIRKLLDSFSWKITAPLRRLTSRSPRSR